MNEKLKVQIGTQKEALSEKHKRLKKKNCKILLDS